MVVIVLTDPGCKIQKSKDLFKISFGFSKKPVSYVPADIVDHIIIDSTSSITSGGFDLIKEYGIAVFWPNYQSIGMWLLPQVMNGLVVVRKAQYKAIENRKAVILATSIISQSCMNKISTIKKVGRRRSKFKDHGKQLEDETSKIISDFKQYSTYEDLDSIRNNLMGLEAAFNVSYYDKLRELATMQGINFGNRTRRPAEDMVNAILNYGYAILKTQIVNALVISGLDIYAGFIHTDRSGKASLVLDMMEEFRQICVDEILIELMLGKKIPKDDPEQAVIISDDLKQDFLSSFFLNLELKISNKKLKHHIIIQARKLVKFLMGQNKKYAPFKNKVVI
ncbi:MAG: CRISPR-associated endonuclease Cas1 [Candidatus Heimdallarchaeota archaeon]|nr:CRISPR-associated endonuclease Cas1 [Candidatus Heimdallarchaeota archaeon]